MKLSFWHWLGIVIIICIIASFFLKLKALNVIDHAAKNGTDLNSYT